MLVPTGRHPKVVALARASADHAESYVQDTLDPMVDDLRRLTVRTVSGDRLTRTVVEDVERLRALVRALPGTVAEQVSRAKSLEDLPDLVVDDPSLHRELTRMSNEYPWMAPQLVHLRHAVSRQAIDQQVITPAADQLGL